MKTSRPSSPSRTSMTVAASRSGTSANDGTSLTGPRPGRSSGIVQFRPAVGDDRDLVALHVDELAVAVAHADEGEAGRRSVGHRLVDATLQTPEQDGPR